jgi:hypothetical protein
LFTFTRLSELIDKSISDVDFSELMCCELVFVEDAVDVVGVYLAFVGLHRFVFLIDSPSFKSWDKVDIKNGIGNV